MIDLGTMPVNHRPGKALRWSSGLLRRRHNGIFIGAVGSTWQCSSQPQLSVATRPPASFFASPIHVPHALRPCQFIILSVLMNVWRVRQQYLVHRSEGGYL